jgi:hypothetical protein
MSSSLTFEGLKSGGFSWIQRSWQAGRLGKEAFSHPPHKAYSASGQDLSGEQSSG